MLGAVVALLCALLAPVARAQATMKLTPDHGPPKSRVTVDGSGFESCLPGLKLPASVRLDWDGAPVATAQIDAYGSFQGFVDVPADAAPRSHPVRASCPVAHAPVSPGTDIPVPAAPGLLAEVLSVTRDFVVEPAAPETLVLTPASGAAGQGFTAEGTGFDCPAEEPVVLRWEQQELDRVRPTDGAFEKQLTVPGDAPPGAHPVEAYCGPAAEYDATATFTVLASGGNSPTAPTTEPTPEPTTGPSPGASSKAPDPSTGPAPTGPALRVAPGAGRPGQQVELTGSGFDCGGAEAELSWNDVVWERVDTGTGNGFVVTTRIAANARPGHYRLRAVCPDRPEMAGTTDFEVLAADSGSGSPASPSSSGTGTPGLGGDHATPIALVVGPTAGGALVLAALVGAHLLGRRRGPRWVSGHVAVAPAAGAPPRPQVGDTADPAGPGHTVRLESRSDPGTHRIEETGGEATGSEETEEEGP
ncbi:hypothetical protein ACFP3U_00355 [Kitasatospora misakiensis]|uniref:Ig-like domain-containing protein n=1 Tax=Kitasatospora misakiensis TaxID=67330 RepID=A0ABW0WTN8_9ACTN